MAILETGTEAPVGGPLIDPPIDRRLSTRRSLGSLLLALAAACEDGMGGGGNE